MAKVEDVNTIEMKNGSIQVEMNGHGKKGPLENGLTNHNEASSLIVDRVEMSEKTAAQLHTAALVVSWFSVLFSLGTGVAAIVLGLSGKSESLFAYGIDAILDSLSSIAVVWRFHGNADSVYMVNRERTACMVIGGLFLVSASSLITKGVVAIVGRKHESKEVTLYESFALTCGVVSVLIAAAKIYVGYRLKSQALATDSIITLVGAAACFAGVAGLELYVNDTHLWYMDSVFGILCGLFLLVFGIR
ncbi:transmembrane protein 163 [Aplysia californica]|uniref:Transmembrane protein 163 n=1 Tax=Aplysia californica TaxID=6500 RepID=A0ABM0K9R9_APLCA|nr:transmembrane protein 163 [Aplysia californica]